MSADDSFSPVDRLEFTVLVDNALEWMTALPPGFTNEVRLQLQNGLPRDIETGVPILDLPHFCCGAHGLSILVTTERDGQRRTLLFDTGPDGSALERNLSALKISANDIDTIVLSHWHSDHTGGLLTALSHIGKDKGKSCVVDAHASYPSARGILPPGATEVLARLPADPTFEEIQRIGTTLRTYQGGDGHATLGGTAWVSGEIPRQFEWESGLKGSVRWNPVERAWHPDEVPSSNLAPYPY
ncbi:hypothetical protein BKA62DRAFT_687262 [Auriculariales sp. MPI-PUGE-AT-0066]|nr:hypothetical protein BKA62DRAFT_687262 [Auriculariales sp. MPI-PUGE-AT-0066]